jgi:hypothetical protein
LVLGRTNITKFNLFTGISISGAKLYGTTRRVFRRRNETQDLRSYQHVYVDHSISFTRIDDSDIAHGFKIKQMSHTVKIILINNQRRQNMALHFFIKSLNLIPVNIQHAYIMMGQMRMFLN